MHRRPAFSENGKLFPCLKTLSLSHLGSFRMTTYIFWNGPGNINVLEVMDKEYASPMLPGTVTLNSWYWRENTNVSWTEAQLSSACNKVKVPQKWVESSFAIILEGNLFVSLPTRPICCAWERRHFCQLLWLVSWKVIVERNAINDVAPFPKRTNCRRLTFPSNYWNLKFKNEGPPLRLSRSFIIWKFTSGNVHP